MTTTPNPRADIRWFCPTCGRTDPRHPDTRPLDLPVRHNRPEHTGQELWDESRQCSGRRIAQRFDSATRSWVPS